MLPGCGRSRCAWALLVAAVWVCGAIRPALAAPVFGLVDGSTIIVHGTIDQVTPYDAAKLTVYRVRVDRVLLGDVAVGDSVDLAQEMLFPNTPRYFTNGAATLIFAVPLPGFTAYRNVLPEGRYWRWTERLDAAGDVAVAMDPAVEQAVTHYVDVRADPERSADFLAATLAGPNARLRNDALVAASRRREIPPLLDAARLRAVEAWLDDDRQSVVERAQMLVMLARLRASGIIAIAERRASVTGPLQAPAVDALVSLDHVPAVDHLLAWSDGKDEALRLAAARGLAKTGTPATFDRLTAMLQHDPSPNVALGIVQALGGVSDPRAVPMLAAELEGTEKTRVTAAADSLGQIRSPQAIQALGRALDKGKPDAQAAAAFALKRSNTGDGLVILQEQEKGHPDPNVRKLCRLAIGESMHEH